jgi:hypothetical protein
MSKKASSIQSLIQEEGYLYYLLHTNQTDAPSELISLESKLRGIGFLLEANDSEILPSEGDLRAVGNILKEIAGELLQLRNFIEAHPSKVSKDGSGA